MEQKIFTLGPWGGNGGDKWDDGHFNGVREIRVECSSSFHQVILSVAVVYHSQGWCAQGDKHGASGPDKGQTHKIKLDYPKEYLIGLSGHITHDRGGRRQYIQSLTFRSNCRSFGPFGYENGIPFEFTNKTLEIVSFHGQSGWFVDSIGIHLRHHPIPSEQTKAIARAPKEPEGKDDSALGIYGKDLTKLAKNGKLDPVIGRDDEIRMCMQILSRRTKNNPVLIGDPGVGKTAIAEGLAGKIVQGDVPQVLRNRRLISVDMGALIAGTTYRGQFEGRLEAILKQVTESNRQIMLFIDEIHMVVGAGATSNGAMDAANLLKPMLSKGELQCIGATTLNEHRKYIEKDSALERRFQPVYVDQPSVKNTITILRGLKDKYEVHHGVRISDSALVDAATLSDRYITGRFLPDKAIDLVDEAAAKLKMEMTSKPTALDKIDRSILELEVEKRSLKNEEDADSKARLVTIEVELSTHINRQKELTENWIREKYVMGQINTLKKLRDDMTLQFEQAERQYDIDNAAEIRISLESVKQQLESAEAELNEHRNSRGTMLREEVTKKDIAEIVSKWTGIPVSKVQQSETDKLLKAEEELRGRIVGQDPAVKAVAKAIQCSRARLSDPHRPIASFMFMGPTGVGKTELAKALAFYMFNKEDALVRIDMSEYKDRLSVSRLIGAPPGHREHDAAGQLTERIRRRPYSVVLFDEIEKAHPDILDILLPILDDGRVTDSSGRTVNFTNTVIIMTSNVGSQDILKVNAAENALPNGDNGGNGNGNDNDNGGNGNGNVGNGNGSGSGSGSADEAIKKREMDSALSHFRPEFINRVDECIVFQPLNRDQIIDIVNLQLKLVKKRIEDDHKIKIQVTDDAIKLLAEWGYDPRYGARPVKRVIRQYILTELAQGFLKEEFKEKDTISIEKETASKLSFKRLDLILEEGSTSTAQSST